MCKGKKPYVSVIVPVYNGADYIDQCIASVIGQTYKELEILVIDDGSTDETPKKVKRWTRENSRIKYYAQQNRGSGAARNYGIKLAKGEYIAFLDADDFWHEDALKKIISGMPDGLCDIIGSFFTYYQGNQFLEGNLHRNYFSRQETGGRWICFADEQSCYYFWSYLYRREFLINNTLFFPDYLRFQDPPFLIRALLKAEKYYVIPVEWYCYRREKGREFPLVVPQKMRDYMAGCTEVLQMAKEHKLDKLSEEVIRELNNITAMIIRQIVSGDRELLSLVAGLYDCEQKGVAIEVLQFLDSAVHNKCRECIDGFVEAANKASKLIIYGAGIRGKKFYEKIMGLDIRTEIVFAETNEPVCAEVMEKKCYRISDLAADRKSALVVVAVTQSAQNELLETIRGLKFDHYICYAGEFQAAIECSDLL